MAALGGHFNLRLRDVGFSRDSPDGLRIRGLSPRVEARATSHLAPDLVGSSSQRSKALSDSFCLVSTRHLSWGFQRSSLHRHELATSTPASDPSLLTKHLGLRPPLATWGARSVFAVSHRLDGFLRLEPCGSVAPRSRSWDSPCSDLISGPFEPNLRSPRRITLQSLFLFRSLPLSRDPALLTSTFQGKWVFRVLFREKIRNRSRRCHLGRPDALLGFSSSFMNFAPKGRLPEESVVFVQTTPRHPPGGRNHGLGTTSPCRSKERSSRPQGCSPRRRVRRRGG